MELVEKLDLFDNFDGPKMGFAHFLYFLVKKVFRVEKGMDRIIYSPT